jgi:hypothetical protein
LARVFGVLIALVAVLVGAVALGEAVAWPVYETRLVVEALFAVTIGLFGVALVCASRR